MKNKMMMGLAGWLLLLGATLPAAAAPPEQAEPAGDVYTVEAGDSLWLIATERLGDGNLFPAIVAATNDKNKSDNTFAIIADPAKIQAGWKLLIPSSTSALQAEGSLPANGQVETLVEGLQFPEKPYWSARDNRLYFLEWSGDKIWTWQDGQAQLFLETGAGSGPSGMLQDSEGNFWVALYSALEVVKLSPTGQVLHTLDNYQGQPFKGPNDMALDAQGGLYFTDSGNFEDDWLTGREVGAVYYFSPQGELKQVGDKLSYANGVALSLDGKTLVVNEHRKNRMLQYTINPDGTWSAPVVFHQLDNNCLLDAAVCYELGPDGLWRDSQGNYWVAHYGGGKIVVLDEAGQLVRNLALPQGRYPTNVALSPDENTLYVSESEQGVLYQINVSQQ